MPNKKQRIVFDANFFICMLQIRARNIIGNLSKAANELGYEYYISEIVFEEIKAPQTYIEKLRQIINGGRLSQDAVMFTQNSEML